MIQVEDSDGVAVVRLAHGKVNAMDVELLASIRDTFRELATSSVRAVVLTGEGRAFSAGVDLRRLVDGGPEYVRAFLPVLSAAFEAVFEHPTPVVAAVNGHALAGGFVLYQACDERLLADGRGRVGVPEVLVGVPFPSAALEIVRYACGLLAQRLVITGATFAMPEAVERGLGDELVPADALLERALERARFFVDKIPAATFRMTKRQLRAHATARIRAGQGADDAAVEELWVRPDAGAWIDRYLAEVTGG